MSLILPAHLLDGTQRFRQEAFASIDPADPVAREWTARLQAVDPRLMMVRARENVVPGVPMKPGHYHVAVDDGRLISFTVVEGEHGEYVEPTSRVYDKLAAGDMREQRTLDRYAAHERLERAANDAEQAANKAERREHLKGLVDAATRTSVPGPGVTPWRQNQAGHRRAT